MEVHVKRLLIITARVVALAGLGLIIAGIWRASEYAGMVSAGVAVFIVSAVAAEMIEL